jgi:hypothetical protein
MLVHVQALIIKWIYINDELIIKAASLIFRPKPLLLQKILNALGHHHGTK